MNKFLEPYWSGQGQTWAINVYLNIHLFPLMLKFSRYEKLNMVHILKQEPFC